LTPLLIAVLCRELEPLLVSSRVSRVTQSADETVELEFYHPDRDTLFLVAALLPLKPLLFAARRKPPSLSKPPNFCRSLRKHLEYAQLTGIESIPGERIVHFRFKTSEGPFQLVFEGIPKYPNLILAGADNAIVSALRYKNEVERPVMPQAPYAAPPRPQELPNLFDLDAAALMGLWEKAGKPPLAPWFKYALRGTDPELIAYLAFFNESAFEVWEQTRETVLNKGWNRFDLVASHPPSLRLFPGAAEPRGGIKTFTSAHEALQGFFDLETSYRDWTREKTRLEAEINRALKHEKRIQEKLKKDRREAEHSDQYQWWGELVMASLHQIKPYSKQADLEDVVRGSPGMAAVPLDPDLTALQNARRYFKKAQKGSRGLALVEKREKEVQARVNELKSAQRSLPALKNSDEIRRAFLAIFSKKLASPRGAPEPAAKAPKPREEKIPTPNIMRVKLNADFELCAGTSAAANETVTFQLAQPEDLWFHVRDLPGSHVILRRLRRGVPATEELIHRAALLAAAQSKAQPGAKVEVSYTEKKYVKKIPGAPLGLVSMSKEKSLFIEVPKA
jgi:predicted ribosome quality control (RQC) complex YloA/Tae2 family protein